MRRRSPPAKARPSRPRSRAAGAEPRLYFAYGSNTNPSQMAHRCPGAKFWGLATTPGRLAFSVRREGEVYGVATIVDCEDSEVTGVLWEVTRTHLRDLDYYEGHPEVYRREIRLVNDGRPREAAVYVLPVVAPAGPHPHYLATILAGYRRHEIDPTPVLAWTGDRE